MAAHTDRRRRSPLLEALSGRGRKTSGAAEGAPPAQSTRRPRAAVRDVVRRTAHLGALSALALAQPLFDILGRHPEFFATRRSSSTEIVVFALVVAFGPPLVLGVAVAAAHAAGPRVASSVHLVLVGALVATFALTVARRVGDASTAPTFAAAALAGGLGAVAYARAAAARSLLSVLSPAPVVFLALFLFASPVTDLVFVDEVEARAAPVAARTPVVMVVFDELNSTWLLDRRGRVDAERYPTFARLAREGLWFRNATAVHAHTHQAVPALLTGAITRRGQLPVLADHPDNLFTLLGSSYRMRVVETLTDLCPRRFCRSGRATAGVDAQTSSRAEAEALAADAGIVFLHLVTPSDLARGLPSIDDTWGNFLRRGDDGEAERGFCGRGMCRFARLIDGQRRPTLFFLHVLLPHVPWQYLPTGERYASDVRRIPGMDGSRWTNDAGLTVQAQQRALLQLGYTDRALGRLLERLRATGVYDRALLVVTADHGASFTPGEPRRGATRRNLAEIAFVPLFVKPPRSRRGRVVDSPARSIDVLPTIADVLGVRVPWRTDGTSLLGGGRVPAVVRMELPNAVLEAPLGRLKRERAALLRRQLRRFGSGSFERVYRAGPRPRLVGRAVTTLPGASAAGRSAVVDGSAVLRVDARSDLLPVYVTGRLEGGRAGDTVAVAVDGSVAAVTTTYRGDGQTRFAALVSPRTLPPGDHSVAVYLVLGTAASPALAPLSGDVAVYRLVSRGTGTALVSPAGRTIPVVRGAFTGSARATARPHTVVFGGWAVDARARRAAELVVVVAGESSVFVADARSYNRADVVRRFGVSNAGFIFEVPRSALGPAGVRRARVYAVAHDRATQLPIR